MGGSGATLKARLESGWLCWTRTEEGLELALAAHPSQEAASRSYRRTSGDSSVQSCPFAAVQCQRCRIGGARPSLHSASFDSASRHSADSLPRSSHTIPIDITLRRYPLHSASLPPFIPSTFAASFLAASSTETATTRSKLVDSTAKTADKTSAAIPIVSCFSSLFYRSLDPGQVS